MSHYPSPIILLVLLLLSACGREEAAEPAVRSHLSGQITVSADVDPTEDYRGFEVAVLGADLAGADTLGFAVTDSSGAFAMEVSAADRGVYPLYISRRGTLLKSGELVVADGDSAVMNITLPSASRLLRIRSSENAAWIAYRNTKAQFNESLFDLVRQQAYEQEAVVTNVARTSTMLWNLRETFPGTVGADIAAAESVIMLEGWDDRLLVARAREIDPSNPSFIDVARAARRARAREAGQSEALQLIQEFIARTKDREQMAALHAEIVIAHIDSLNEGEALRAARTIKQTYPKTRWAEWADRATYEVTNLMPGAAAPAFTVTTVDGEKVSLAGLEGQAVILEFYVPGNELFERQIAARNGLAEVGDGSVAIISISLEPDSVLNEAFLESRELPGFHVIAAEAAESQIAKAYNITVVPTRVLIDPRGRLSGKFVGDAMLPLQAGLADVLASDGPQDPPS